MTEQDQFTSVSQNPQLRGVGSAQDAALQRVIDKQYADKVKLTIKKLLKKIDSDSTGCVKFDVLQNLLDLHKVKLSSQDLNELRLNSRALKKPGQGDSQDVVDYKVALKSIDINSDSKDPNATWCLKSKLGADADGKSVAGSAFSGMTSVKSLQRLANTQHKQQMKLINNNLTSIKKSKPQNIVGSVTPIKNSQEKDVDLEEPKFSEIHIKGGDMTPEKTSLATIEKGSLATAEGLELETAQMSSAFKLLPKKNSKQPNHMNYEKKSTLQEKWLTDATSLKTITGENDRGYHLPQKGAMNMESGKRNDNLNLVSNKEWGNHYSTMEEQIYKDPHSVSLTGVASKPLFGGSPKHKAEERPNPMRSELVDQYLKKLQNISKSSLGPGTDEHARVDAVEQIYRLNIDNRILNNLRLELNERIENESGIVSVDIFRKMFFTYFKGEVTAHQIYDRILPIISVYFDPSTKKELDPNDKNATQDKKVVKIQSLTEFIDLFNYYPVKVHTIRYKNESNNLTYVMNSNQHGTLDGQGKRLKKQKESFSDEEQKLRKLLKLVSDKIYQRFQNLQTCFRKLDLDHTQSLSLNEFAQAIEHMRLKLSFEDTTLLFRYLDKSADGAIGYDEFTMLLEERWRGIDPYESLKQSYIERGKKVAAANQSTSALTKSGKASPADMQQLFGAEGKTNLEQLETLETLAVQQRKGAYNNPRSKESQDLIDKQNRSVNQSYAEDYIEKARNMHGHGVPSTVQGDMGNVLKHDYLRESMEQRIQRKELYKQFVRAQKQASASIAYRDTNATKLRSKSVAEGLDRSCPSPTSSKAVNFNDYGMMKQNIAQIMKANQRLMAQVEGQSKQARSHANPSMLQPNTARAKSHSALPALAGHAATSNENAEAYQTALRQSINNLQKAQNTITIAESKAQNKIEIDKASQMSKQDRADAMKQFYSEKRNMTVKKVQPKQQI